MDKPEISIIVPVYKVETYIDKCINSILGQEFKNFELILVDDGSPDRCGDICEAYKKKDQRVIVVHRNNRGLASARNIGISMAKGRYIAFVDSDDWISPSMYQLLYTVIQKTGADIAQCDFFMVEEEANLDFYNEKKKRVSIQSGKRAVYEIYGKRGLMYTVVWNKLFKKSLFTKIRFPEGRIHEDEFINYKLYYYSTKVAILWRKLYYYRQRKGSILHHKYSRQRLDKYLALNKRMRFLSERNESVLYQETLHFYIENLVNDYKLCCFQKIEPEMKRKIISFILAKCIQFLKARRISKEDKRKLLIFLFLPFRLQEFLGL